MSNLAIKTFFDKKDVQNKFKELIGNNYTNFITSVLQEVHNNTSLVSCEPMSVYNAAAMAAVLNLPINNNLGLAYIVPYKNKAQFQVGWKGFVRLALNSGEYKTIGATEIYEGQLIQNNPLTGYVFDFNKPIAGKKIIGYAASFTLLNGFEKTIYMSTEEVQTHMKKYSKSYHKETSVWKTDFPSMALKTVLKRLISKYGPMSLTVQKAILSDQSVVNDYENGEFEYVDNDNVEESLVNEKIINVDSNLNDEII